ncbi:hypothetical protein WAI453_007857 [Rhynchosporium graminicola]
MFCYRTFDYHSHHEFLNARIHKIPHYSKSPCWNDRNQCINGETESRDRPYNTLGYRRSKVNGWLDPRSDPESGRALQEGANGC